MRRATRAAERLRETLGRQREGLSGLLDAKQHRRQLRPYEEEEQEQALMGRMEQQQQLWSWRGMGRQARELLAGARALRPEVDAQASASASLQGGGAASNRGSGVRGLTAVLAECLAAELCLRIGRAAASHAERCATALSEAQAAAREVSQLLHRASLAELDPMPGRITCYLASSSVTHNNGPNKTLDAGTK